MNPTIEKAAPIKKTAFWYLYLVSAIVLAFTGFGQMPLYKRYYISDIPGLGWSADFYTTHLLHYIFSALLLGIAAYVVVDYLLLKKRHTTLTLSGIIRSAILAGLVVTGLLLVIYNFSGVFFSTWVAFALLVSHMMLAMALSSCIPRRACQTACQSEAEEPSETPA